MPRRLPNVQGAMATVSRRLRMKRVATRMAPPKQALGTTRATSTEAAVAVAADSSLFVSPLLVDVHAQLTALSSSSLLPSQARGCETNLRGTLSAFLQTAPGAVPPGKSGSSSSSSNATVLNQTTSEITDNGTSTRSQKHTSHLIQAYNPTLDPTIVQHVANSIDVTGVLQHARDFLRAFEKGGDYGRLLNALSEMHPRPTMQGIELQSGIATRLRHRDRARLLRSFRLRASDVQVAEVLPSGKIVTFTEPTLPKTENVEAGESYVHFVLYKEALPLNEAISLLSQASDGVCLPEDFATNVALEDSAVTVQVCSLHIRLPPTTSLSHSEYKAAVLRQMLRVNLRPLRIGVQVLGWRSFPCDPRNSSQCRMQYSMLLRGLTGQTDVLEKKVMTSLTSFPNYFGPRHFGFSPLLSHPFRTYHAAEALQRGMIAEALIITSCLSEDVMVTEGGWVGKLLPLLRSGEERPAVLRQWYELNVPWRLKLQIAASRDAFIWNVMCSCRIHEMKNVAVESLPLPGDFVVAKKGFGSSHLMKPELFPECTVISPERVGFKRFSPDEVLPIVTEEMATPYTMRDVVIPIHIGGDNEVVERLAHSLGFHFKRARRHTSLQWRPLLATADGHPRAVRPWVKALPEPVHASTGGSSGVYKLLTDMELRRTTNYTSTSNLPSTSNSASRGDRQDVVWPIGRYGYRLAERLPAGAISLASSDGKREVSKSLALHFTLPFQAYSMASLREYVMVEDHSVSVLQKTLTRQDNATHALGLGETSITASPGTTPPLAEKSDLDGNLMARMR